MKEILFIIAAFWLLDSSLRMFTSLYADKSGSSNDGR